jgi:glyoxylase-like metal-dependent hydrolase (beta-lactamase superfamily II)
MKIQTFTLGPLGTNGYLASRAGRAVFVDPGGDPAPVLAALSAGGLTLEAVLLTHLHCDHVYGCAALARATGAPVLLGEADLPLQDTELGGGGFMGLPLVEPFEPTPLAPGPARFLDQPCTVLPTPGHSPGSLSFHFPDQGVVFVGDVLFRRSIGRTDFPGGDLDILLAAVREHLFTLPPETVVYSGHGPATTIGDEMAHNPFLNGVY